MIPNWFRLAFRTLPFLDTQAGSPSGVVELRTRPVRQLLVWHPDAIDSIFRGRELLPVPSRTLSPLLGRKSLLWAAGIRHCSYRRVLGPPLQSRQLQPCQHIISDTVHAAIDPLAPGTVISLVEWTRKVTLRIISQVVFGCADDLLLGRFSAWVDSVLNSRASTLACRYLRSDTPSTSARAPFLSTRHKMDRMLLRSAKAAASSRPSVLAALLLAADSPLGALDDDELRDQIVSLLFAGHETTASATAWTLYWLHRDEQMRHDVIAELAATSNNGSDPAQVPLLHAVIQEALRRTPPAIIAGKRILPTDGQLLGKPLAAGTVVTPCIYLANQSPDIFPNPRKFDPERFLGNRFSHPHYFPFGGGTRRCLGSELAMLEIRMIAAALLRRCELRCVNPGAGIPELRGPAMTIARDLRILVTVRRALS